MTFFLHILAIFSCEYFNKDYIILKDLYRVQCHNESMFAIQLSDDMHPVFKAHFPNHPILPGFVLLDISAEVLHVEIASITKAKFLQTILPQSLLYFYCKINGKRIQIIVKQNEQKVADLNYEKR